MAEPEALSRGGHRRLRGLMRVFLPSAPAPEVTGSLEEAVVDQSLRLMKYMHPVVRLGLKLAMFLVDWSPIWRLRGVRRLSNTPPEVATRVIHGMGVSRLPVVRTLVFGVRGLLLSVYFDQPEVHEALGYRPVPFMRSRIALRHRLLEGGTPTPSDGLGHHSEVTR